MVININLIGKKTLSKDRYSIQYIEYGVRDGRLSIIKTTDTSDYSRPSGEEIIKTNTTQKIEIDVEDLPSIILSLQKILY